MNTRGCYNGKADRDKKAALGALTDREAMKVANQLVVAREMEIDHMHERLARAVAGDPRTFGDVVDRWLAERRADGRDGLLKPSTLADYEGACRRPAQAVGKRREPHARIMREFGERKPREISGADISGFLMKLRDEDGLSERTRAKYGVIIGMILAYALDEGWIAKNPMLDRKRAKRAKRQRKALTV